MLSPIDAGEIVQAWSPEDLRLQIDVRLRVDENSPSQDVTREDQRAPTPAEMQRLAGSIYDARRKRDKMIAEEFFGEPALDMLLALYCLPARGETLSVTSLSYAANVPQTTGLRVQSVLMERGLIERVAETSDKRRLIIRLTEKGLRLLETYFVSLISSSRTYSSFAGFA